MKILNNFSVGLLTKTDGINIGKIICRATPIFISGIISSVALITLLSVANKKNDNAIKEWIEDTGGWKKALLIASLCVGLPTSSVLLSSLPFYSRYQTAPLSKLKTFQGILISSLFLKMNYTHYLDKWPLGSTCGPENLRRYKKLPLSQKILHSIQLIVGLCPVVLIANQFSAPKAVTIIATAGVFSALITNYPYPYQDVAIRLYNELAIQPTDC